MANPYPARLTEDNGKVRFVGDVDFTDAGNQPGGGIPQGGPLTEDLDGGGQAITQLDSVTIATSAEAAVTTPSPLVVTDTTAGTAAYASVTLNSDGLGNVDSGFNVGARGTGTPAVTASDDTLDGWFQWFTAYGWEHQPRSTEADATPTFVLHGKTGAKLIEARAGATLGFYGATPVAQQTGVAVDVAAIHAALVALGLITA